MPVTLTPAQARRRLVAHLGLTRVLGRGAPGTRKVLNRLRCIQLDPLDVIGTNADLVVLARVDNVRRGDVYRHLFPRHAFEHFAKERCILPADAFPYYRVQGHKAQVSWWRHHERLRRLPKKLITAVLDEVQLHGPVSAADITDHGAVAPLDWSGWTGTSKATTMALEVLWTRCDIVVAGRNASGAKLYDVPARALPAAAGLPQQPFDRWALLERVRAAGLLSCGGSAAWSALNRVRNTPLPGRLLADGELVEVIIEGSSRRYFATPDFLTAPLPRFDGRVRVLGPLDPLLWDRTLVRSVFDFDYVWEVYKPAGKRIWGWYVCPLLYRDRLVGRLDAQNGNVWLEREVDQEAVRAALSRAGVASAAFSVAEGGSGEPDRA